jgi:hypothetical protein
LDDEELRRLEAEEENDADEDDLEDLGDKRDQ